MFLVRITGSRFATSWILLPICTIFSFAASKFSIHAFWLVCTNLRFFIVVICLLLIALLFFASFVIPLVFVLLLVLLPLLLLFPFFLALFLLFLLFSIFSLAAFIVGRSLSIISMLIIPLSPFFFNVFISTLSPVIPLVSIVFLLLSSSLSIDNALPVCSLFSLLVTFLPLFFLLLPLFLLLFPLFPPRSRRGTTFPRLSLYR